MENIFSGDEHRRDEMRTKHWSASAVDAWEGAPLEATGRFVYAAPMAGLFDGTPLERPVTCELCEQPLDPCACPRNAAGAIVRPKDQPARVGREKRRKGETVTVVSGLDPVASDLGSLLAKLKSACAAGGTINDGRIEVQGDHREKILAILQDLGYPAKLTGG